MIGRVGTILGSSEIKNFALGRKHETREAVGIVNVDSSIPESVLQEIRSLPQILRAQLVGIGV